MASDKTTAEGVVAQGYAPARRIADLADDDKPREKAIRLGIDKLSVAELIAIVLGSGLPGKSVIELSREILDTCGNDPEQLARLSIAEMVRKFKGVGPAKAVTLSAAIALGQACAARRRYEMPQVRRSADAYDYVSGSMAHLPHEEFRILMLTRANRIKSMSTISSGGTTATVVDVKMVIKQAIDALADGLILVHNHPSGNLTPSPQDDQLTRRIAEAAALCDIRVMDHIIVSSSGYYSYADEGKL